MNNSSKKTSSFQSCHSAGTGTVHPFFPENVTENRPRLILKNGRCNIHQAESKRQRLHFFQFSKLVNSSWFVTISMFLATLMSTCFLFAIVWWVICYSHGDFEPEHLPHVQKINHFVPCIYNVHNFASCLLFSIETQHTVGYGIKAPTDECPEAIFVNALQCIIGYIMQGGMAVVIFAKMTLPRLRSKTLLFSKNAVICPRNGRLHFMLRIGDMRKFHIIDASVRAFLVKAQKTSEGEFLQNHQTEIALQADKSCSTDLFFNWPLIVTHKIDLKSPLYFLSPGDFLRGGFEIVVVLEGAILSTGQMTQARTSYVSSEILWGRKFQPVVCFNKDRGEFEADFSKFDIVAPVRTPLCSAAYFDDYQKIQQDKDLFQSGFHSRFQLDFTPRHSHSELEFKGINKKS